MKRQWLYLLLTLPAWLLLLASTSKAESCTSTRVWSKADNSYVYTFTCEIIYADSTLPASVPASDLSPSPSTASPSPSDAQSPTLLPTAPAPLPTPDITDSASFSTPTDLVITPSVPEDTAVVNDVVLPISVAEAVKTLDNPTTAIKTAFIHPAKFLKSLSHVGADMKPEVRKQAQSVVVSAIIVVQVVGGAVTTLMRKP